MQRSELYTETQRWHEQIMIIFDLQQKLEKQKREVEKTQQQLQQTCNELPEGVFRAYEELRCFDRLKG